MKKIFLTTIILIAIITASIVSCDKISKPYKPDQGSMNAICDTPSFPALNNVIQKYLLEDFTGQKCVYCPRAQDVSSELKTLMGDTLVIMAIHAGDFAKPNVADTGDCAFRADYRTPAGDEYATTFGVSSYPSGMINRTFFGGKQILDYAKWKELFRDMVRTAPSLGLQIETLGSAGDSICIFVKTTLLENISDSLRLCVFITEDSIVSPQMKLTTKVCDYVHMHMLRTTVSPTWGDKISLSAKDESQIKGYTIQLGDKVRNRANCHVIAFIYAETVNREILQVEEVKLTP
jgi:hypothetical protein